LGEELRSEVESGGGGGDGAGGLGKGGLVGGEVGGIQIGFSPGFAGFEDVGGEGRAAEVFQIKLFHEGAEEELAARDGFFDAEEWGGGGGAVEGVGKKAGTWGEAFGGGAEGGPPTGAGFLEEE
jgi:hypothetical protein